MFLSPFIHSNYFFQTITQSSYIALSQNTIRTRNKISTGVLIIRRRNNYTRAGAVGTQNFFFRKKLTVPKIVPKTPYSIS